MKKILSVVAMSLIGLLAVAQNDTVPQPPYKRFPTVPPFKILLIDSITWFSKEDLPAKKATMVMVFNPECEHCKHETEEIIKNIDKFRKIEIVMATPMAFENMKEFYLHYDLARFKNIKLGRDVGFMLPVFFDVRNLPFLAFYDKKGNLIDVAAGSLPIEQVLEKFND